VEHLNGERKLINRAYMVFVALDDDDKPIPVPKFTPETLEEQYEFSAALNRKQIRQQEREENARIERICEVQEP
jgi:acyl-CoA hydrolase